MRWAVLAVALAACSSKTPAAEKKPTTPDARPAPPSPMKVTITNQRAATIWVYAATECAQWPIWVTDADGGHVRTGEQVITCEMSRANQCVDFGDCVGRGAYRLEPGASFETTWDELVSNDRQLKPGEGCQTSCVSNDPVPPGTYTLHADAWSACTGDDCACATSPCQKPEKLPVDPDLAITATVTVPDTTEATLVFQ